MIATILRALSLLFTGLFAGFLLGILVLELSLRGFSGTVYIQTQQVALVAIPALASVLLLPAIVTTGLVVVMTLRRRGRAFWLTAVALLLLIAALLVTLIVNVPINLAEGAWSVTSPPTDWAARRDLWQVGHVVRTGAALLAFGALIWAALLRRPAVRGRR
ncbi:anthrone oxygenase family protein [Leifsonia sp. SIMBA_070]|uniref:anthrone oxygenase family protein n=1 Tax=Leifsonia sp. SIMBA_070 TaxID=3085810 RepID=UPI003979DEEC